MGKAKRAHAVRNLDNLRMVVPNERSMSRYRRSQAAGAMYFFIVTLADRRSALLTESIEKLRIAYGDACTKHPFHTVAICVLPEHLHAIWQLPANDAGFSRRWSAIKTAFSRGFPAGPTRTASKSARREKGIWQRRYWEHQIRDDDDLQRHVDYIHFNPVKHGLVSRVQDWPYSSFHRFVQRGWLALDWAGDAAGEIVGNAGERR